MKTAIKTTVKDPVCGMTIDAETAHGKSEYSGKTYHFCSKSCLETFEQNPQNFVAGGGEEAENSAASANGKSSESLKNADVLSGKRNDHSTTDGSAERVDLPITGMTCAACANRIEKVLSKQTGVDGASVNFATGRATVNYNPEKTNVADLIQTVKDVGYDTAGTSSIEFVVDDSARPSGSSVQLENH